MQANTSAHCSHIFTPILFRKCSMATGFCTNASPLA
jgi:hypothetical protein